MRNQLPGVAQVRALLAPVLARVNVALAGYMQIFEDRVTRRPMALCSDGTLVSLSGSGGGGVTAHDDLTLLTWASSGHTGDAAKVAAFGVGGEAVYFELGVDLQAHDDLLDGIAGIATAGLVAHTGSGAAAARTLTAGSAQLSVTNGSGAAGNPTVDLVYAAALRETGGPTTLSIGAIPAGSLAQRSGTTMVGLSGTSDGQVPRWDATTSAWVATSIALVASIGTHFDMPAAVASNNPDTVEAVNVVIA